MPSLRTDSTTASETPLVSIVTPSYNQGPFLEAAMQSVITQDYPHVEYIVIDGGSTDGSEAIIRSHEKDLAYWVSEPDRGQSHALNKGLNRCNGILLGWLNADDRLRPGALQAFVDAWRACPEAGAWVGAAEIVDSAGKVQSVVAPSRLDRDGIADWTENGFSQPACLFSKAAWTQCGPIDESLFIPMDVDFWLKIAAAYPLVPIAATLAAATSHPEAKTKAHVNLRDAELWMVMMRHGYWDLARKRMLERLGRDDALRQKAAILAELPGYAFVQPLFRQLWKCTLRRREGLCAADLQGSSTMAAGASMK